MEDENKYYGYKYLFVRKRLGSKTISKYGETYGPYLYKNIITNELIASFNPPIKNKIIHHSDDLDMCCDALIYYKNF